MSFAWSFYLFVRKLANLLKYYNIINIYRYIGCDGDEHSFFDIFQVADCILLMSLDKPAAIPVDTHMFQIAANQVLVQIVCSTLKCPVFIAFILFLIAAWLNGKHFKHP